MNTVAEFCELLCQLDVGKPNAACEARIQTTRSTLPQRLNCGYDDDDDSHAPLLVALESSDGEASDSSDAEDGSLPFKAPPLGKDGMVVVDQSEDEEHSVRRYTTRHVSFQAVVHVREYALTVGALTSMEKGELPLQLDWGYTDAVLRLSQNQSACRQEPPRLSLDMRRARLKRVSGYTDRELDRITTAAKLVSVLNFFHF
jgi:hypothetical protein